MRSASHLRRAAAAAAVAALALVAPGAADAAGGGLAPLPPPIGCVTLSGTTGQCLAGRALAGTADVALSSDGRSAYAVAPGSDAVAVFARDATTGGLTQLAGTDGCLSAGGPTGQCTPAAGLTGASAVAVSPGGKTVYATSRRGIAVFSRDPATSRLTQLPGPAGCVATGAAGTACAEGRALGGAGAVAVSRDGLSVYVASSGGGGAVAVFRADPANGALTQPDGAAGCLSETGAEGCAEGRDLGAAGLAVAPDGHSVYVAATANDAVAVLSRDPATGALTQLAGPAGCVSAASPGGGCAPGRGLNGATSVAVHPSGRFVYATGGRDGALAAFARDPASGALTQLALAAGCLGGAGPADGCSAARGLAGASDIALARAGSHVYVTSSTPGGVAAFSITPAGGQLTPLAGADGCLSEGGVEGCAPGRALAGASAVVVSSDSRHVYVAAPGAEGISGLKRATAAPAAGRASGDFDGDGRVDLAVGASGEALGRIRAGAVQVLYGTGRSETVAQSTPGIEGSDERGDEFGSAVAAGDFDGDGWDDLAIGAPGEDLGGRRDSGAVVVLRGSPAGLTARGSDLFSSNSGGVAGAAGTGGRLGAVLAVGDVNGDRRADLVMGAPGARIRGARDAGAVRVLEGGDGGLSPVSGKLVTQDSSGVRGAPEAGDAFGSALALCDFDRDGRDDVAIGVPDETLRGRREAGLVQLAFGSDRGLTARTQLFSQETPGVPGAPEPGDGFGSRLACGDFDGDLSADLAVGVPGENLGRRADAGSVDVLRGSAAGVSAERVRAITQDSPLVAGAPERGDAFGDALASADWNGDGRADLVVGSPGESIGRARGAGSAYAFYGTPRGLNAGGQLLSQDTPGVLGHPEGGDAFGSSLGALDAEGDAQADLAISSPGESAGRTRAAGVVTLVRGSSAGLLASGSRNVVQGASGLAGRPERGDLFGAAASLGAR